MAIQVLLVEDDLDMQQWVEQVLPRQDYQLQIVGDVAAARLYLAETVPDILLLDINLPDGNGLELLAEINQSATSPMPVLILSALDQEAVIVTALECGADDYVIKPCSVQILVARMDALLRRVKFATDSDEAARLLEYEGLRVDCDAVQVDYKGLRIKLTKSEFRVLAEFCRKPTVVFTRSQLAVVVHGEGAPSTTRSIDVMIATLRRKMGPLAEWIQTVRGIGYKLEKSD
ncbi:MAG: response regulator transcription factor [Leptospiraceae bacterium]|nr:response regulator transcription factor [Leptospiraceae bacterium]